MKPSDRDVGDREVRGGEARGRDVGGRGASGGSGVHSREGSGEGPDDVLEHNLRNLFARAYVPLVPAVEFRARLTGMLRAQSEETARNQVVPARAGGRNGSLPSARPWPVHFNLHPKSVRPLVAAAALLVVVLGTWFALRHAHGTTSSLDQVLAQGCVAWRAPDETRWSALDESEARRGIEVGDRALEVATPAKSDVRVRFGSLGLATLGTDSHATFPVSVPIAMELATGTLSIERYDSGAAWTLGASGSVVELERGSIELSVADAAAYGAQGTCLVAHLTRGIARARVDQQWIALDPGTRIVLQSGRALETSVGVEDPSAHSPRVPAISVGAAQPGDEASARPPPDKARLEARLLPPPGLPLPRRWKVTLLRRERLPEISRPIEYDFSGPERFAIDGLLPGEYEVFVDTADFAVWRNSGVVLEAKSPRALEVQLQLGQSIRGRVVDAASGAPVEGAVVLSEGDIPAQVIPLTFTDPPTWSTVATTLSDGTFELLHLPAGECVLRATHAGFGATWSGWVDPAHAGEPLVMRLPRGGSVSGHVAHEDKSPWRGAYIVASHIGRDKGVSGQRLSRMGYGIATTDASGDYRIDDLPAGSFVVLNALDVVTASSVRQATIVAASTIVVDLPERVTGARVTGTLFTHDGKPKSGMDVTLQPAGTRDRDGWRSVQSGADGAFVFNGLHEGSYDVYVGTEMGRLFLRQDHLEVPLTGTLEHDVHLATGILEGRVKRADDGTPCARSFLLVEERVGDGFTFAGIHFTRDDGGFTIHHVRAGTWRILAYPSERGLAPLTSTDLVVSDDSPSPTCELAVQRGASLRVSVKDPSGTPVSGCDVAFVDAGGEAVQLTTQDTTGASGLLDVPGLAAGHWTIHARAGELASPPTVIDLLPGDDREIDLVVGHR